MISTGLFSCSTGLPEASGRVAYQTLPEIFMAIAHQILSMARRSIGSRSQLVRSSATYSKDVELKIKETSVDAALTDLRFFSKLYDPVTILAYVWGE